MTSSVIRAGEHDDMEAGHRKVVRIDEFKTVRDGAGRVLPCGSANCTPERRPSGGAPRLREQRAALTGPEIAHRFAMLSYLRSQTR